MAGFLDSLSEASERGREALARCMLPLTLTPKTNGPGRFEASGTIDLATVVASGSSGGSIRTSFYAISKGFSEILLARPDAGG